MKLLLDTHIFLWLNQAPEKIPAALLDMCHDCTNTLYLSYASIWEIQIKNQLGKLDLNFPLKQIIETQQNENDLKLFPIKLAHIYGLKKLEHYHNDPFDRLLIAQSSVENIPIITIDNKFKLYPTISLI